MGGLECQGEEIGGGRWYVSPGDLCIGPRENVL